MIPSSKIRRRAGLAAIGLATVAATTVPASALFAATSSKSPAPSHHAVRRIHLVEREIATPHLDLGKPGPSMGDRGTITSDMLDRHGKVVGRADADCGLSAVGRRMGGLCTIVVTLPGGQITGTFFESFGPGAGEEGVVRQAITGGTGRYEGARGQFIVGQETTAATPITIELVS